MTFLDRERLEQSLQIPLATCGNAGDGNITFVNA
jgi:hypothetical protein